MIVYYEYCLDCENSIIRKHRVVVFGLAQVQTHGDQQSQVAGNQD